jgi:hypothetical protein
VGRLSFAVIVVLAAGGGGGCRERAKAMESEAAVRELVRRLGTQAEHVTGLRFKRPVAVRLRTRDQVRAYIIHKFDQDLPPRELAGAEAAYKLFGLIPDSLDLRHTIVDLLTEQVAGYYDPDSAALFIPTDQGDPAKVRLVASHELVHALQDQYLPLDSIINQHGANDRRSAAQSVLEGQATFYQISILMPEQHPESLPEHWFWRQREAMAQLQAEMPAFSGAPLWLRETLIFPYLGGADFISWFVRTYPGREPYGPAMPTSTEQILHPDRYAARDEPVVLSFAGPAGDTVRYEDGLGEFETGLLFSELLRDSTEDRSRTAAQGWGGDRYRVYGAHADALVWYSVWDDTAARDRFVRTLTSAWTERRAGNAGRRYRVDALTIDGRPGARLVDAPHEWVGWKALPGVKIVR